MLCCWWYRYKNLKEDYLAKSPRGKWWVIRQSHCFMTKVIGCQVMQADFKLNINTLVPLYVQVNFYLLVLYTWYYYRNDLINALLVTPIFGLIVPVS